MSIQTSDEIVLSTFEDVRMALINPDLTRSLDRERHERDNILDHVLMVLHGDEHRARRQVENRLFRRETLLLYERGLFPDIIRATLAKIGLDGRSELVELGSLLTIVLSARTVGIDFNSESLDERRRLVELRHIFSRGISIDAATVDLDELKAQVGYALDVFNIEFFRPSLERRRSLVQAAGADRIGDEALPRDELPRDLLTTLLLAQDELGLDDALLLREAAFFLDAGADTSTQALTSTLDFMFWWLDKRPRDWQRLQTDRLFAQRCVHEALRLRPPNTRIMRRALQDTQVNEQSIAAGSMVRLDTGTANRDPLVYSPHPDQFDPYRELPVTVPRFGHAFSGGGHACIGRNQAVGLPIRFAGDPTPDHQYGLVTLMVQAMAGRNVRPDPTNAAVTQTGTKRVTRWERYPVLVSPPTSGALGAKGV